LDNWSKENLESLIDAVGKFDLISQCPSGAGNVPGGTKMSDVPKEKADEFWQQESVPFHSGSFVLEAVKGGHNPPISIYETIKDATHKRRKLD